MSSPKRPRSTWRFDQGVLTVTRQGETVSLGRYATHALAARTAALYIALHDGADARPVEAVVPLE